jgi:phosphatidyl-myo-inositol dimannoside synthase
VLQYETMKKRILAIGHSFVLAQNRDLFRFLQSHYPCEVTIIAPSFFHGDLRDIHIEDEPSGSTMKCVPISCQWTKKIHFFRYNSKEINEYLAENVFDHAFVWEEPYIFSGFQLQQILKKQNIPYSIYTNQNIFKKYPFPFSYFESRVLKKATTVYGCGEEILKVMKKKGASRGLVLLPYFVNRDRFRIKSESEKNEVLKKLKLAENATIGFMGRLVEEKGIREFMEIADFVLKNKKCNIIVIGKGPLHDEVSLWTKTKTNTVLLNLTHSEVPGVLPALDVLLCPSQTRHHWKEQFGRMLIEAFASGVAVIGSDSGEIPHVVEDSGLVLGEQDLASWKNQTLRLIEDEKIRKEWIQKGLLRAKYYSVENVAQILWQSFEREFEKSSSDDQNKSLRPHL